MQVGLEAVAVSVGQRLLAEATSSNIFLATKFGRDADLPSGMTGDDDLPRDEGCDWVLAGTRARTEDLLITNQLLYH